MKERPILFSGPMVRAILDGRKTQTRRVVKPQSSVDVLSNGAVTIEGWVPELRCPFGTVGDRLLVCAQIHGQDNYCAGSDGNIYSRVRSPEWKQLKASGTPYLSVTFCKPNRRSFSVHSLVCEAFHGPKPSDSHLVRHIDGDGLNNDPGNLAWGTFSENEADKRSHGTVARGESHGQSKLTRDEVELIRASVSRGLCTTKRASEVFSIHEGSVRKLLSSGWENETVEIIKHPSLYTILEIESIRLERLQEISEEDAKAEGVRWTAGATTQSTPRSAFMHLWESIHGHGSWDANPWVWCIEFRKVEDGK